MALLGFGTVGQSVARILCSGEVPHVQLTHIFNRNVARKRVDWVPSSVCWTESADDVLASDVDIVIELVGGLRPAYDWVRGALMAGKSVVTANKQLMAHHGTELLDLARVARARSAVRSVGRRRHSRCCARCRKGSPAIASSKCAAS